MKRVNLPLMMVEDRAILADKLGLSSVGEAFWIKEKILHNDFQIKPLPGRKKANWRRYLIEIPEQAWSDNR